MFLIFYKRSRMKPSKERAKVGAVAVFRTDAIVGEVVATATDHGTHLCATFTSLPPGPHGFHLHTAGDLRGEGCQGLCEHYDKGGHCHGDGPHSKGERHTGDLGNIEMRKKKITRHYDLKGVGSKRKRRTTYGSKRKRRTTYGSKRKRRTTGTRKAGSTS